MEKALEILQEIDDIELNKYHKNKKIIYSENDCNYIKQAISELEEAMKPKTCEWKQCTSEYGTSWEGTCGAKWTIEHGTPKENVVNFCPQCGGKLVEIEPKDDA